MSITLFNRRSWCGALVSGLGLVACGPLEAPSSGAELQKTEAALPGPVVASCADIKAAGLPLDRDHVLYQNADSARPYVAYCTTDGGTYLTLPTGTNNNYSQKLNVSGQSVTTRWSRVRLNPQTLAIDTTDFRFSTSTGYISRWGQSTVAYGAAGDCVGLRSSTGRAGVDLTGLPFAVTATWQTVGYEAAGTATKSSNDQVVNVSGGGYCGDMAVSGALTLSYVGYGSCAAVAAVGGTLDQEYTLYLGTDGQKAYPGYCPAAGGTYLTLPSGTANNYSQKLNVGGDSVTTRWERVRFDPQALTLDVSDFRFATSTGHIRQWNQSTVNYGSAGDCVGSYSSTGRANVDLTGLPFVVTANWGTVGYNASGVATKSFDAQAVSVTGGGFCGDNAVNGPLTVSYRNRFPR